jgi:hypothetical protein
MKLVGEQVASFSKELVQALVADPDLPEITDRQTAETAIDRVVKQSDFFHSERIWAAVFSVLTAALAVPDVQAMLGPWAPVVTAVISAVLVGLSKYSDQRPIR